MDWDLDCHCVDMSFLKKTFCCSLLSGMMHHCWKLTSLSPNFLSFDKMRKVSQISMLTGASTVEIMNAISPAPLSDINPICGWLWKCACFSGSHLYMFHWTCVKLKFQNHPFIWFPTVHECFYLAHWNLVLFPLDLTYLLSHFIQLVLVIMQDLILVLLK